jgi:hypothetical protein
MEKKENISEFFILNYYLMYFITNYNKFQICKNFYLLIFFLRIIIILKLINYIKMRRISYYIWCNFEIKLVS